MGELGSRLAGPSRGRTIKLLTRAYADEWFGHYNFRYVAHTLQGHRSPDIARLLRRKSGAALDRADSLAGRLREMGAQPVARMADLKDVASAKPFKLPRSFRDTDRFLLAVLDACRTSIRTFKELLDLTREADPVTAALAVRFLADAIRDEEDFETLLGDPAPEMTGR